MWFLGIHGLVYSSGHDWETLFVATEGTKEGIVNAMTLY